MNKAAFTLLCMMAFGFLSASAGFADQSSQNSSGNIAAPSGNANNGNTQPQLSSTPANAHANNANAAKSGNAGSRHGSGPGIIGGAAKNAVSINGTAMPRLKY
jgi:hypothetical protein